MFDFEKRNMINKNKRKSPANVGSQKGENDLNFNMNVFDFEKRNTINKNKRKIIRKSKNKKICCVV